MDRDRAKELAPIIAAWGDGKTVEFFDRGTWKEADFPKWGDDTEYRIKPVPKMRPMTRGEVLYLITTTPAMVVRFSKDTEIIPYTAQNCDWEDAQIKNGEWAVIDKSGNPIDGWHKFETANTEEAKS